MNNAKAIFTTILRTLIGVHIRIWRASKANKELLGLLLVYDLIALPIALLMGIKNSFLFLIGQFIFVAILLNILGKDEVSDQEIDMETDRILEGMEVTPISTEN